MIYLQASRTPFSLPDFEAMWETLTGLGGVWPLVGVGLMALLLIGGITLAGNNYNLSGIKSKTVGDGQHGTARWATASEMKKAIAYVPFTVNAWRRGEKRPTRQGLVLGCEKTLRGMTALVKKVYYIGPPKRNKTREIRVADEVMGWLAEQKDEQMRLKSLAGKAWHNEWNLVFTREFGEHLVPYTVYQNFKRIVGKIDLNDQRIHNLRHAYATNSLGNGDDPETVRKNLGHYSIIMLDRYGHRKSSMAIAAHRG